MSSADEKVAITPRQLEVLQTMCRFETAQCYSPTIAELADQLNLSRTTVFEHIGALRKKGLLTVSLGRARSSMLTRRASQLLDSFGKREDLNDGSSCDQRSGIPLAGRIAAGVPIEAIEEAERISLRDVFGSGDDIFALQVRGESMIDDGINSGDYVVCKRSSCANDGQMVVAIVDDQEATLKRFYREKGHVRLQPANERCEPIYSDNCRIEAIVLGVLRHF